MEIYCSRETNACINFKTLSILLGPVYLRHPTFSSTSPQKMDLLINKMFYWDLSGMVYLFFFFKAKVTRWQHTVSLNTLKSDQGDWLLADYLFKLNTYKITSKAFFAANLHWAKTKEMGLYLYSTSEWQKTGSKWPFVEWMNIWVTGLTWKSIHLAFRMGDGLYRTSVD